MNAALGADPNVFSHLPLGLLWKPAELGFTQCSVRHTHLALTTQEIDDFPLRGLLRMLWSPSSFEVEGKRSMHGTFHQFQQRLLHSTFCRRCGAQGLLSWTQMNYQHSYHQARALQRGHPISSRESLSSTMLGAFKDEICPSVPLEKHVTFC